MDFKKMIDNFQILNKKITSYEDERNKLQVIIKNLDKDTKKLEDKIKKESDSVLKSLYKSKIVSNKYFVDTINSIFNFNSTKEVSKNDKTQ